MKFSLVRQWGLLVAVMAAVLAGMALVDDTAAQQPTRELTATEAASHVLNRMAFGPRPGQVEEVAKTGWKKWAEEQLHPEKIEPGQILEKRLKDHCPTLFMTLDQLQKFSNTGKKKALKGEAAILKKELQEAVLLRSVYSRTQFHEVISEFWRNHFNVDVNKVPALAAHYEQNVIRKHSFGKFEDFLLATAKHPAMLVYLDNYISNKRGLNENYARELMELHTLGVDNFYQQKDVVNLARVLTGWTCGVKSKNYNFFFNANDHDTTAVNVVGLDLDGQGGVADGEKAVRYLANHEGTARFISTKLCRYLVHDFPSSELIDRVSGVFRKTGGDLREVYKAIVFSPEFMDPANFRAKFKTPFEYTISSLRITRALIDNPTAIFKELKTMGQPIFEHEEPTGYSDQKEAWLDPGIMVYRWNFAIALVTDKVNGVKIGQGFVDEVVKTTAKARPKKVVDMILPGINDLKTQQLAAQTTDTRAMVAWALGSPGFQQQ